MKKYITNSMHIFLLVVSFVISSSAFAQGISHVPVITNSQNTVSLNEDLRLTFDSAPSGFNQVQIEVITPTNSTFTSVANIDASNTEYQYNIAEIGEYRFRIRLSGVLPPPFPPFIIFSEFSDEFVIQSQRPGPPIHSSVDTSFNPIIGGGSVYSVITQPDGKLLIGGDFKTVNGLGLASLARLNIDGSVDISFNPGIIEAKPDGVRSLALQSDGKILIGGRFVAISGISVPGIARLNSNGSIDSAFNPVITDQIIDSDGNSAVRVRSIAVQPNGKIVVGGIFSRRLEGSPAFASNLIRLNSNGSFDVAISRPQQSNVRAVALQADGKIVSGGYLPTSTGVPLLSRSNADGSVDRSFTGSQPNSGISALAIQSDQKILLGGRFTNTRISRVNSDGTADTDFISTVFVGANGPVNAIALQTDGKILLAGGFNRFNNIRARNIVRLNIDGSVDPSFDTGNTLQLNTSEGAIAVQTDGKVVVGGGYEQLIRFKNL